MIEACTDRNILTLCSTNGHYLQTLDDALKVVDAGLTKMIIAMDGSTQEIYQAYRKRGDIEKVKRCAALIEEAKSLRGSRLPYTNLRVVVTRHTEEDLHEIKKLAKELGVNMFSYKDVDPQGFPEKVEEYRPSYGSLFPFGDNIFKRRRRTLLSCIFPLRQPTIFWDGTVVGCEYDYDLESPWGKIGEKSFTQIWNNPKALDLRSALREGPGNVLCPRLCPYQHRAPFGTEFWCKELRSQEP
jgi:MoaA/NifB/PqqE/SkfB family radical SAM enzyme